MSDSARQVVGLYERHGRAWDADRKRAKFVERNWLDRFITFLPATGRVLDLGCGGAEPMAGHLIRNGFSVTGIDSAPTMIALSKSRHPAQEWQVGDMRMLSLGRVFDGVIAWDSFFHLTPDDQRRAFAIFAAHAAPGAPLLFSSGPRHGEGIGSYGGEPLYHASLAPEEYRALLAENGFEEMAFVPDDKDCAGHTIWLARRLKAR
jgi:SAM-dependent methyltransferase